ncbi:proton-conducting transporter membrane subunit [Actinotalea sp. M2MS4P-6]|uniref:proton-conducting transporter transmembrane domain-containing protein n=1 Tax=Actinotalea sp. M2MS4P-6 TaxID=2983762 RepID=UPI0021E444D3|nr:proton-conducting transporter membrane subunit [Actinotalea sp. M2MS4P-6]MCV2395704.1 proton-conducting transporter membrane subunit [Actinotalea sp. M2MS4P-6]
MAGVLILPLLAAATLALLAAVTSWRPVTAWSGVVTSGAVLVSGLALVAHRGPVPELAGGLLRADALSAYLLTVVGAVGLTATWAGLPSARTGTATRAERRYAAMVSVFLGAMSVAVLTDNLGLLWVAIEATTIATAFLVGHRGTRRALEAAWKYVMLGSVGVAIALLGVVLLYAASRSAGDATLSWVVLTSGRLPLDPGLVRVAGALAVLGLATKAGLVPMHAWLPDAHSQAPAPVSALMSGVLLAVAFYGILRVQVVVDAVVGPGLMRGLLLTAGLGSLLVSAALVWRQRDYKRLLAWSSVEHMGLMAVGAAVGGPLALAAVLLHVLGHGLAKATAFVTAGRILEVEGTSRIDEVRGLLARRPLLAGLLVTAAAVLLGMPPFALFFSEVGLVVAGWRGGLGWAMGVVLVALLVVFAGVARAVLAMVSGPAAGPDPGDTAAGSAGRGPVAPLVLALAVTAVAGFLSASVGEAIARAVAVVTG